MNISTFEAWHPSENGLWSPGAMTDSTEAEPDATMTIDDLSAQTKVPSRTIRYYQSRGALQPPVIVGRVARYNEEHIERLALIGQLKDRGLRIRAICDLVKRIEKGSGDLGQWLGITDALQGSWSDEEPTLVSSTGLQEMLGETERPGLIARLQELGLVEKQGRQYLVRSPALLKLGLKLQAADIDLEVALEASSLIEKHMRRAAHDLVEFFIKKASDAFGPDATLESIEARFGMLRPAGLEAVRLTFAREMENRLRAMVDKGQLPLKRVRKPRPAKPKKKRG